MWIRGLLPCDEGVYLEINSFPGMIQTETGYFGMEWVSVNHHHVEMNSSFK